MKISTLIIGGTTAFLAYKYYQNATALTVTTSSGVTTFNSPSLTSANPNINLGSVSAVLNSVGSGIYGFFFNQQSSGGIK
jgi:hypothetical protein